MKKPVLAALLSVKSYILSDFEKKLFEKYNPMGVVLLNRNISSLQQVCNLIKSIKDAIGREDVIIALDEEGGRVNPLKYAGFGDYVSQNILGQVDDVDITCLHAKLIAQDMKKIGANFTFAPVLDINYPEITVALKNRSFGLDTKKIVKHAKVLCDTYICEGICPCIKHIPGHGRAVSDPHADMPIISDSIETLETDFYPFKQLNYMPVAMSAHILLSQIDAKNPVTLSEKAISEIIRKKIGFDGLLISDALDMHALKGTIIQKAEGAWNAGCDVVCYSSAYEDEMEQLCKTGKLIEGKSAQRYEEVRKIINFKKDIITLDKEQKRYYTATSMYTEEFISYDADKVLRQLKGEKKC